MNKIKTKLDLLKASKKYHRPHKSQFKKWFTDTVQFIAENEKHSERLGDRSELSVCVRLVEKEEMYHLAARFRHRTDSATVLSFPCEDGASLKLPLLGDIVMCGEAITDEASTHHIDFKEHWAFLFIHSVLHLFNFEHGEEMENIEDAIMDYCNIA